MKRKFIIYTHGYDENSGGKIALHQLCNLLNKEGECAYLWPAKRPLFDPKHFFRSLRKMLTYKIKKSRRTFETFDGFDTPIAQVSDLDDAIVIYPEVVDQNPLLAQHVVRWFLHKPGFHTNQINYGKNELYFLYSTICKNKEVKTDPDNILEVRQVRDDIYKQYNFGERSGSAYMIRKGLGKTLVHDLENSVLVDSLSHTEMAKVFNKVKYFISYDPYTLYSRYAAVCGCISIIVPEEKVTRDEWEPTEELRYGLAYGFDDIEHALKTRELVLPYLKQQEIEVNTSIRKFIHKCETFFK